MSNSSNDGEYVNKNAPHRTDRRAARQGNLKRAHRGRRIIVRSELREQPDVRKIAKAIIEMALAEADAERQAQADAERQSGGDREDRDE